MADIDSNYMRMALWEARKGKGRTSPNPCVGALIVNNGKIVGKGFHKKAGGPHAEIHALHSAGTRAKGATLYVTLEPCNHTGRTPPCTEAILKAGINQVVIGMRDPNPQVAGGGAEFLTSEGLSVITGVMEQECREINLPFIKHSATGMPWVILKAGMSIDGRIAELPGQPTAITGRQSLARVHALRHQVDAILVGIETVLADDPSLTTRRPKTRTGRDPLRIVLDADLRLPESAKILQQDSAAETWIFCRKNADKERRQKLEAAGAVVKRISSGSKGRLDIRAMLQILGRARITSLLVEGGSKVHGTFLASGLADQLFLFVAPRFLGEKGVPLATFPDAKRNKMLNLDIVKTRRLGDDVLIEGRFAKTKTQPDSHERKG